MIKFLSWNVLITALAYYVVGKSETVDNICIAAMVVFKLYGIAAVGMASLVLLKSIYG